jgi:hypothetical protein
MRSRRLPVASLAQVCVGLTALLATLLLSATPASAAFPPQFGGPRGEEAGEFFEPESVAVDNCRTGLGEACSTCSRQNAKDLAGKPPSASTSTPASPATETFPRRGCPQILIVIRPATPRTVQTDPATLLEIRHGMLTRSGVT